MTEMLSSIIFYSNFYCGGMNVTSLHLGDVNRGQVFTIGAMLLVALL